MKWTRKQVIVIVYIILVIYILKNIQDSKNTTANGSQLELQTRLQYNFYWLFNNSIKIY